MKSSALVLVLAVAARASAEPARPLLLAAPGVRPATQAAIARAAAPRKVEIAAPPTLPELASEAIVSQVRPLYQRMDFLPAAQQLGRAEDQFIATALPTSSVIRALAEIELWRGACLFLARDRAGAFEHWSLAARLDEHLRPDRIFPPEVQAAFARRPRAPRPVRVTARVAPAGARLWIDGRLVVEASPAATPELHYVALERADFVPVGRFVRITRGSAELALSLKQPATPQSAVAQTWERLRQGPLEPDEGLGLSRVLARAVFIVSERNDQFVAERYDAADASHPTGRVETAGANPESVVEALCQKSPCAPLPAPAPPSLPVVATAPLIVSAPPPPPRKPVWKQWWLWTGVAAGIVVAAVVTGASVAATSTRNYDVRIR